MDQGEAEADGERRETGRRLAMGRAHDDEQEHHGHHHLGQEGRGQAVFAGRMLAIAVRGEALGEIETRRADRDEIEHGGGEDGADDLGDDVGHHLAGREAPAGGEADRDGRVEMTAGDMADRIGHGDDGQTERERYTKQPDADLRKARRDHGAAAAGEGQPEGTDHLCDIVSRAHLDSPFGCDHRTVIAAQSSVNLAQTQGQAAPMQGGSAITTGRDGPRFLATRRRVAGTALGTTSRDALRWRHRRGLFGAGRWEYRHGGAFGR
ncbi:hypothetical protein BOSE62_70081 [Bosea sp. 62]|nr:hypothetical protein BOSE46_90479 [Bosea sp. 46]VXB68588.1 hypothetical protein BOSE125_140191 [Bosea sp. 125]VXC68352.1 hypothetical protein BOSE62_70081 [Bosea sp. 62]VXC94385.1 hypothetical protein BOSE127_80214 [Bosea sp. 127]VXC96214.1 hypothetical protein BOSE29B_90096 [Bosea sp. 29B]